MRVLVIDDAGLNAYESIEIVKIGYDNDIREDGRSSGLYFWDYHQYVYYIEGLNKEECNSICTYISEHGYCDLRKYGSYVRLGGDRLWGIIK